ncbi:hypothetical protein [Nitrosopumilus sp.]|uniref:hypothetical protein n=1 Tax=Nitrosopumilus sp. TaxID=2024843 RepID=UPI00262683D7|nr:hypothetical protein [Nitrosopumilus sp.]
MNQNTYKKKILGSAVTTIMIFSVFFAGMSELSPEAQGLEKVFDYKIIFATSWSSCSERNLDSLSMYDSVVQQYLHKYNVGFNTMTHECVNKKFVQKTVDETREGSLVIVITDAYTSYLWTKATETHGKYVDGKTHHVIVSTSSSLLSEPAKNIWTLSHELSHFALKQKIMAIHDSRYDELTDNFAKEVIIDWVHDIQKKKNSCEKNYSSLNFCSELWTTITTPSGNLHPVMTVYPYLDALEELQNPKKNIKHESSLHVAVNGYNVYNAKEGETVCIKIDSRYGDTPLIKKNVELYYWTIDSNNYVKSTNSNHHTLDEYGFLSICSSWNWDSDDTVYLHAKFDGDRQFMASQSNWVKVY